MDKTIVVGVNRKLRHPEYGKVIQRSSKFKAHDEKNQAKKGDLVEIQEIRRLSKDKRWRLFNIIETAESKGKGQSS